MFFFFYLVLFDIAWQIQLCKSAYDFATMRGRQSLTQTDNCIQCDIRALFERLLNLWNDCVAFHRIDICGHNRIGFSLFQQPVDQFFIAVPDVCLSCTLVFDKPATEHCFRLANVQIVLSRDNLFHQLLFEQETTQAPVEPASRCSPWNNFVDASLFQHTFRCIVQIGKVDSNCVVNVEQRIGALFDCKLQFFYAFDICRILFDFTLQLYERRRKS